MASPNNKEELREWVSAQTAFLDPPDSWQPDAIAALQHFRTRAEADGGRAKWSHWPALAAAVALIGAVILLLPLGRGLAQQLWQFLTVPKLAFIMVNPWPEGVPSPQVKVIGTLIPPIPADNVEEAGWRVHYSPRLPRPAVLSGAPRLYTTFSISAGTAVKAADLELALRRAGITDQAVPPGWDGARLAVHTSPVVIAEWPGIVLAQSLPLTLTAPADFDFPAFSALVLRVVGVGPDEARRMAQRMGTAPPWLAPVNRDFRSLLSLEEIALNSGAATLVQEKDESGAAKRTTMVWRVPDRVYLLDGTLSRELMIAVANAVQ
jgi:hypothetical protein